MGITILMVVMCGVVVSCGKAPPQPSVESMTYQVETTDHLMDFSVKGTAYVSVKRQAYRYDFSGGMSQLFIYPKEGKAYYYYPSSNFQNKQFNVTACYTFRTRHMQELVIPLPSVDGFIDLGPDYVYDIPAEKFAFDGPEKTIEIWVGTLDQKTGIHLRPVLKVLKIWDLSEDLVKEDLNTHYSTAYYGFEVGEQHSPVWDRPNASCIPIGSEDLLTVLYAAVDIGLDPALILSSPHESTSSYNKPPKTEKTHHKGRRSPAAHDPNDQLLLSFPWTPVEYKSIAKELPTSFDWRDFGAVTQVKNQRNCGSCWAHGTVGSVEGAYYLKYGQLITLSEQAMMDCAGSNESNGCFGGYERPGFSWMNQTGGIPPTEEYGAYQETNGYCRITNETRLVAQLEGYYHIPNNTDALKVALVKLGPLVVSIAAEPLTAAYKNGVITKCDAKIVNHAVLLVGYGESTRQGTYWIIKNSWGTTWGLDGYGLISAEGDCLKILDEAYFPVLK